MRTRGAARLAEPARGPGQITEVGLLPFAWTMAPAIVETIKQIGIFVAVSEVASLVAGAFSNEGQAEARTPYPVLDAYRDETAALGVWASERMTKAEFQFVAPVLGAALKLFTPTGPWGAAVPTMAASTVAIIKVREYVQARVAAVNPSGDPVLEGSDTIEFSEADLVEGVDFVIVNGGKVPISNAGRIVLAKGGGIGVYVAIAGAVVLAWWVLRG
jgi:hypothetical protein